MTVARYLHTYHATFQRNARVRDAVKHAERGNDALRALNAATLTAAFNDAVEITGAVLTKMDGDTRGGAALSVREVSGKPIKFTGVGEKMDALEEFHPKRIADRILGMGDIVSLVERASENIDADKARAMAEKMAKGKFDLNDLADQLRQTLQSAESAMTTLEATIDDVRPAAQQLSSSTLPETEAAIRDLRATTRALRNVTEKLNDDGAGAFLNSQPLPEYEP